jgi:hypothetical protein
MTKSPRKTPGELGVTHLSLAEDGMQTATLVPSNLSTNKEELELLFASKFVERFNAERLLGAEVDITALRQNDTTDLDFTITCSAADYLELAELNRRSEEFGREALRTGRFNVYTYARWVWLKLIKSKQKAYGSRTAGRAFLLLYSTHWQFLPTDRVYQCLASVLTHEACTFAGVFVMKTNTTDLTVIDKNLAV